MCHHCPRNVSSKNCSPTCKEGGCSSKTIKQCHFDKNGGVYTINKSGNYNLSKDVQGTLSIQASNVCLDLCCHTLNASGSENAIIVGEKSVSVESLKTSSKTIYNIDNFDRQSLRQNKNLFKDELTNIFKSMKSQKVAAVTVSKNLASGNIQHVRIYNGSITGATSDAILVNKVFDVEIYDITMFNNSINSINVTESESVSMKNINFSGEESGERAVVLNSSSLVKLENLNITKYTSIIGSLIQVLSSSSIILENVSLLNNIKASTSGSFGNPATTMIRFDLCSHINLIRVKINNTTISNTGSARFTGILFLSSKECSMYQCEINNNSKTNLEGEGPNLTVMLLLAFSINIAITECKMNSNSVLGPLIGELSGIYSFGCDNLVCDKININENYIEEIENDNTGGFTGFYSVFTTNVVVRNSQINFNIIDTAGVDRVDGEAYLACFLSASDNCIIENSQMNNNSILNSTGLNMFMEPFVCFGDLSGLTLRNSNFDANIGGEFGAGILIAAEFANVSNITIENCSSSGNTSTGLWIAKFFRYGPSPGVTNNVKILNCVFNNNGKEDFEGRGIYIDGLEGFDGISNILIKGCQIGNTFSGVNARGISVAYANNVVVEDTNVFESGNQGIVFDNVSNSKILRSQVHGNVEEGILLTSTSLNNLIQDNYAINNAIGFDDKSAFANAFLGNKAQENGTDYSGVALVNVSTYSKSAGTYSTVPYSTTNLEIVA